LSAAVLCAACAARGAGGADRSPEPGRSGDAASGVASETLPENSPAARPTAEQDTPLPLRGARGPTVDGGTRTDPCPPDVVLVRLREITSSCRKPDHELCGKVRLVRAQRAADVSVTFDLASSRGAEAFSQCVALRVKDVRWQCAIESAVLELDLGCEL
jgi:hypothetical protein